MSAVEAHSARRPRLLDFVVVLIYQCRTGVYDVGTARGAVGRRDDPAMIVDNDVGADLANYLCENIGIEAPFRNNQEID